MRGGRIGRGWRLAKKSWAVLRADRSLILFPIVSGICTLVALAIFLFPGALVSLADDGREWVLIPFLIAGAYAATFVAIFFNVGLASCAARALDGEDTRLGEGLRSAAARMGPIAAWALIQVTVGVLLSALRGAAEGNGGILAIVGWIASALLSIAWAVMTFFVIPILAFERVGPIAAIKRSLSIVRERWGEGLVGTVSIQAIAGLAALPGIALAVLGGFLIAGGSEATGVPLVVVGVILLAVPLLIGSTLQAIFRVALYRFATADEVVGGFDTDELQHAFVPRRHRGRRGTQPSTT